MFSNCLAVVKCFLNVMSNTLDTKVIIYNVTSSDKPTFKEGPQFIVNLAVIFVFQKHATIFRVRRKILFVNSPI